MWEKGREIREEVKEKQCERKEPQKTIDLIMSGRKKLGELDWLKTLLLVFLLYLFQKLTKSRYHSIFCSYSSLFYGIPL